MRQQQTGHRRFGKRAIAYGVALAAMLGAGSAASAQEQFPAFGMIGLAEHQAANLNLVLLDPPDENRPGCRVTASFVDAAGQVFSDARGIAVRRTFTLRPQVATSLRLLATDAVAPGQARRLIRPVLTAVANDTASSDCTCLLANLELMDSNGQTVLLHTGTQPPPNRGNPPPPPGGSCGS